MNQKIRKLKSVLGVALGAGLSAVIALNSSGVAMAFAMPGREYVPVSSSTGELSFYLTEIDLTFDELEFVYDDTEANGRTLQTITLGWARYYEEGDFNPLAWPDEPYGVLAVQRLYYASHDFGTWPPEEKLDEHRTRYRVAAITNINDLVLDYKIAYLLHFDDDTYWAGWISYADCMTDWKKGAVCQIESMETSAAPFNVKYKSYMKYAGLFDEDDEGGNGQEGEDEVEGGGDDQGSEDKGEDGGEEGEGGGSQDEDKRDENTNQGTESDNKGSENEDNGLDNGEVQDNDVQELGGQGPNNSGVTAGEEIGGTEGGVGEIEGGEAVVETWDGKEVAFMTVAATNGMGDGQVSENSAEENAAENAEESEESAETAESVEGLSKNKMGSATTIGTPKLGDTDQSDNSLWWLWLLVGIAIGGGLSSFLFYISKTRRSRK